MPILELESALTNSGVKPKGIKVGRKLWDALRTANLIHMSDASDWKMIDPGFKLPFYKGIYLVLDPELEHASIGFWIPSGDKGGVVAAHPKPEAMLQKIKKALPPQNQTKPLLRTTSRWLGRS